MKCLIGCRNDDLLLTAMSELQDKLDRREITPQEFFDAWDAEMEENERLHPGFRCLRIVSNGYLEANRVDLRHYINRSGWSKNSPMFPLYWVALSRFAAAKSTLALARAPVRR
jgi:hypothetical protein